MPPPKALACTFPEEHLRLALRAKSPSERLAQAEAGLRFFASEAPLEQSSIGQIAAPREDGLELSVDTKMLLLRQAYLAHVELHQLRRAADIADEMIATGNDLVDIALHDKARALQALADMPGAIEAQRLAARRAPAKRRSFHLWSLATLLHFSGDAEGAISALRRGLRASTRDRALLKAHLAYVQLERREAVEDLAGVMEELAGSPNREGYGRFLMGMIAWELGDPPRAAVHLSAFLRRNAAIDEAKRLTLREELRRARLVLAKIESC
ncbi:MAG: tetratricopeptide repeat protein [Myxococcales bacterium]|nr:tetratricopeptide repeat protein [Myxococcales bacterium]